MVAARKLVIILDGGGGRLAVHAGRGVLTESVQLAMTLHYQLHGALPACLPAVPPPPPRRNTSYIATGRACMQGGLGQV